MLFLVHFPDPHGCCSAGKGGIEVWGLRHSTNQTGCQAASFLFLTFFFLFGRTTRGMAIDNKLLAKQES